MKYDQFEKLIKGKDNPKSVYKLDIVYADWDSRCWTALVGDEKFIVTFHVNRGDLRNESFDLLSSNRNYIDITLVEVLDIIGE